MSENLNLPKFNLRAALEGHPVQLRNGKVAIIAYNASKHFIPGSNGSKFQQPLVGFMFDPDTNELDVTQPYFWCLDGKYDTAQKGEMDIQGMFVQSQPKILEHAFLHNEWLRAYKEDFGWLTAKPIAKDRNGNYLFNTDWTGEGRVEDLEIERLEGYTFEPILG